MQDSELDGDFGRSRDEIAGDIHGAEHLIAISFQLNQLLIAAGSLLSALLDFFVQFFDGVGDFGEGSLSVVDEGQHGAQRVLNVADKVDKGIRDVLRHGCVGLGKGGKQVEQFRHFLLCVRHGFADAASLRGAFRWEK